MRSRGSVGNGFEQEFRGLGCKGALRFCDMGCLSRVFEAFFWNLVIEKNEGSCRVFWLSLVGVTWCPW